MDRENTVYENIIDSNSQLTDMEMGMELMKFTKSNILIHAMEAYIAQTSMISEEALALVN